MISKLHTSERGRFFSFGSILGLAEAYVDSGVNDVVISTVLLCFAQLGFLIMYVARNHLTRTHTPIRNPRRNLLTTDSSRSENDASILDSTTKTTTTDVAEDEVYILGLCTGLLPAAAAATAGSTGELLELGPEMLRISLRLALEADGRSAQLEQSRESWAFAVPGIPTIEVQKAIDNFHNNMVNKKALDSRILLLLFGLGLTPCLCVCTQGHAIPQTYLYQRRI